MTSWRIVTMRPTQTQEIVDALGCTPYQAQALFNAGYESLEHLLRAPSSDVYLVRGIGKEFMVRLAILKELSQLQSVSGGRAI